MKLLLVLHLADRTRSLPSRERGLKYTIGNVTFKSCAVAPFAGAWIEISIFAASLQRAHVAPFAGAWIEIEAL